MSKAGVVALRLEENMRTKLRKWSKEDNRTISSFMNTMLLREDERRSGRVVTLESLHGDLRSMTEVLKALRDEVVELRERLPTRSARRPNELPEVFDLPLPDTLPIETWKEWVIYLRKKGHVLTVDLARKLLERWTAAELEGHDLGDLVEVAMQRGYRDAVFDSHFTSGNETQNEWWKEAR